MLPTRNAVSEYCNAFVSNLLLSQRLCTETEAAREIASSLELEERRQVGGRLVEPRNQSKDFPRRRALGIQAR